MNAKSLIKKVNRALVRVGPTPRVSYLRVSTVVSGDQLTGIGLVTTTNDTLFAPQPFYAQLGKRQALYLSTPSLQLVADDYRFTFPVGQATKSLFQKASASLVLKDANGYEGLKILYIDSAIFGGSDVAITVFARSVGFYAPPDTQDSLQLEDGTYLQMEDGSYLQME
jgi:hypothetical protein